MTFFGLTSFFADTLFQNLVNFCFGDNNTAHRKSAGTFNIFLILKRNATWLKILLYVAMTALYFMATYQLVFLQTQNRLESTPSEVLWRGWCGTMKRVVCYFEEDGVLLWRGWCGTLKRPVVWYFEEGDVVLWRGWCGTLKRVVCYFEEGGVVLWRGFCGTLKRVVWYFEEGDVLLWRGWCGTLKRGMWYFEEVMRYFEEDDVVLWSGGNTQYKNKKMIDFLSICDLRGVMTNFVIYLNLEYFEF